MTGSERVSSIQGYGGRSSTSWSETKKARSRVRVRRSRATLARTRRRQPAARVHIRSVGKTILARDKGKGGSSLQLPSTGSHISVSDSLLFLIICRLRPEGLSTHKKTGHNHHRPSSHVIREQPPCLPSFSRKMKTKIWEFALSEKLKWMEAYYGQFSPNMGWRNVDQFHVNPFKYPEEERRSRGEAVPL